MELSTLFYWLVSSDLLIMMASDECHNDFTDDKSTLVQVMAWCRQATSHYLSQCWLSSLSPYGVARAQWVNMTSITDDISHDIKSTTVNAISICLKSSHHLNTSSNGYDYNCVWFYAFMHDGWRIAINAGNSFGSIEVNCSQSFLHH